MSGATRAADRGVRLLATMSVLAAASVACSVRDTLPPPDCRDGGSAIIVAQSVPTASYVPCLEDLPPGWSVATVVVNQDHSVITFDSDRAGESGAVLRLEDTCPAGAGPLIPTAGEEVARRLVVDRTTSSYRADSFYRFVGGCVTFSFDFDRGARAAESRALADALVLVPRDMLNEGVRQFVGEDA